MEKSDDITYSLIFLNYDPQGVKDWTKKTKANILENSQGYKYELVEVKNVKGYVNAVNEGLRRATGDFLVVLNDDILLDDPDWLSKMTIPNAIVSWKTNPFLLNGEDMPDGACWGLFRDVYEKIGGMDEQYGEGYGCDEIDYFFTAREAGVELKAVPINLRHMENKTYSSDYFRVVKQTMTNRNIALFQAKWAGKYGI